MQSVYSHGGRRFIVAGLPPIGCLPFQITASKNAIRRTCVDHQISDTIAYNSKLKKLLPQLQESLPGSKIAYLDITDNVLEIINNPKKYGFEEAKRGCCGSGLMEVGPLCNIMSPVCKNVSSFVFFDAIHPSERIYRFVTDHIMNNVIPQLY
ncbi:uncharacterized protein A4U43_C02F3310 [Asparagus officinalis]|uniref:Uncharacterized protein n=1 Tax=Asparagus officinalis TaxID=4686 RepID=A0A5P1FKC4_ASPOF|nr:uncharacterized protein A4U43_C02F3310 [Asparagus officinalis]